MEWCFILCTISLIIIVSQFFLSYFNVINKVPSRGIDFDVGSFFSLRELNYFIFGFTWWLWIVGNTLLSTIFFAVLVGIFFAIDLHYLYSFSSNLKFKSNKSTEANLIGEVVIVYLPLSNGKCICKVDAPNYSEIICKPDVKVELGDILIIKDFKDGVYYISKPDD